MNYALPVWISGRIYDIKESPIQKIRSVPLCNYSKWLDSLEDSDYYLPIILTPEISICGYKSSTSMHSCIRNHSPKDTYNTLRQTTHISIPMSYYLYKAPRYLRRRDPFQDFFKFSRGFHPADRQFYAMERMMDKMMQEAFHDIDSAFDNYYSPEWVRVDNGEAPKEKIQNSKSTEGQNKLTDEASKTEPKTESKAELKAEAPVDNSESKQKKTSSAVAKENMQFEDLWSQNSDLSRYTYERAKQLFDEGSTATKESTKTQQPTNPKTEPDDWLGSFKNDGNAKVWATSQQYSSVMRDGKRITVMKKSKRNPDGTVDTEVTESVDDGQGNVETKTLSNQDEAKGITEGDEGSHAASN